MKEYIEELINLEGMSQEDILTHRNYAGFNLLLASLAAEDAEDADPTNPSSISSNSTSGLTVGTRRPRMALVTNSGGGGPLTARWLTDEEVGLNGVSNGIDHITMHLWVKVARGQETLGELVADSKDVPEKEEELIEELFRILG